MCRASLVDSALETGAIYEGSGFKYLKEALPNGTLHLIGLLSDGGVHSRFDQLQVWTATLSVWFILAYFHLLAVYVLLYGVSSLFRTPEESASRRMDPL
jgi:hypothetical protein